MSREPLSFRLPLVLTSAVLCILISDFPQYTWPFASTALVPFFFFLYHEPSLYQVVKYAFLFGGITMAGSIAWFFDAYPLEWAGIENAFVALATIFAVWTLTSLVSAVFSVFFALVFKKACRGSWHDVLMAPSAWILMEYARALFLSLVFLGDQSSIGADWGLNLFGYSLAWSRLGINLAPLGGVFLMSFIGVLLNYAIFFMTRRLWEMKRNVATVSLFLAGSFAAYSSAYVLPMERNVLHDPQVVAVITTNFQALSDSNLLSGSAKAISLERLLREAVSGSPDIIVLPEGSRALDYLGTTTIQALLSQGQKEVLLIDSSQVSDPLGRKSRALFFSSSHGTIGSSDKSFLMPYGEYLPYIATLAGRFAGQGAWVTTFARNRTYQRGTESTPAHFKGHTLGVLFCSEIIPESPYRSLSKRGSDILVNIASHADFHGNDASLYNQIISSAKVKAASNNRFFIRAGNMTPSFISDDQGTLIEWDARGVPGVTFAYVAFNTTETLYTRFGDWVIPVAVLAISWLALAKKTEKAEG